MAIEPRRTEVSRDQVAKWIAGYNNRTGAFKDSTTLEDYVRGKIAGLNLVDDMVMTEGHNDLKDTTHIADMIVADLGSY